MNSFLLTLEEINNQIIIPKELNLNEQCYILLFVSNYTYTGLHAFTFKDMIKKNRNINEILKLELKDIYPELYDNYVLNMFPERWKYVENIFIAELTIIKNFLLNNPVNTIMDMSIFNYEDIGQPIAYLWDQFTDEIEWKGIISYKSGIFHTNYPNSIIILLDYEDMIKEFSKNDPINPSTNISYPSKLTNEIKEKYMTEIILWNNFLKIK